MTSVFDTYHPIVAFAYIASAVVLCMAFIHPVMVGLSFAGALACSLITRGARKTALSFAWIVPVWLVVMLANPLFSPVGTTELARIGTRAVYLESLVFGSCVGGMFASVLLWFTSYSACMNSENSMALFGRVLPVVTLMVSQVLRLVPQYVSRGRAIFDVQAANSAAAPANKRQSAQARFRVVSVLMGWGMEDGLVRSDAMRARGYESGMKRTTYKRFRMSGADWLVLAGTLALAGASAAVGVRAHGMFWFYPTLDPLPFWWGYAVYALLMALPALLALKEWLTWRL